MITKDTYTGIFDHWHKNPPAGFNPDFDPGAKQRFADVTASLEADNFYATHTRQECKTEWHKRYESLKALSPGHFIDTHA